jgi:sterol 3beta-glucosyltransferase
MKITIITMGSRGDAQPFVALGMGLVQVGHEVMICTSDCFKSLIQERGLHYTYMNDDGG